MLSLTLTIAAACWTAIIIATPFAAARGRAPWVVALVYQIGALICHQRPERSFHLAGIQMPVCARCFGLYAAGAAGLLLAWAVRTRRVSQHSRDVLAVAALPIAISLGLEWAGAITTSNLFRTMTAVPLGLVAGLVIVDVLRRPSEAAKT